MQKYIFFSYCAKIHFLFLPCKNTFSFPNVQKSILFSYRAKIHFLFLPCKNTFSFPTVQKFIFFSYRAKIHFLFLPSTNTFSFPTVQKCIFLYNTVVFLGRHKILICLLFWAKHIFLISWKHTFSLFLGNCKIFFILDKNTIYFSYCEKKHFSSLCNVHYVQCTFHLLLCKHQLYNGVIHIFFI